MNTGKTLFAQLMDFLPWSTFDRIVARYHGNRAVRTLPCTAQYQVMAFAQITYRESLRDIEACLSAQSARATRSSRSSSSGVQLILNTLSQLSGHRDTLGTRWALRCYRTHLVSRG